jgi:hypothetical protein
MSFIVIKLIQFSDSIIFLKLLELILGFLKYVSTSIEEGLTELDRLRLENKKEWSTSHLLGLIEHEDTSNKFS